MIGYHCKYAPVELMAGFGEECRLLNREAVNFNYANGRMHPNLCTHAKATLEEIHSGNDSGILFVNCCDSARRVYDMLPGETIPFSYSFDLPVCGISCAVNKLKKDLLSFIKIYADYSGRPFDISAFLAAFKKAKPLPKGNFVALLGARSNETLKNALKESFQTQIFDMTCAENRNVPPLDIAESGSLDKMMEQYAYALLNQTPCLRMQDVRARRFLLESENCIGVVYHTVQFCDYYHYEYAALKDLSVPMIKVETDFTNQSYGQLVTRLEGFSETVEKVQNRTKGLKKMNGSYYIGIDSGSTSTELVALDENKKTIKQIMVKTGANALEGAKKALSQSGISKEEIHCLVATGYGRKNIHFAQDNITEITCHAKGAKHLFNDATAVIDIGGQDSKVMVLDEKGNIMNFVMNDKCAAGTGRFLENMAKALELDMADMAQIGLLYKNDLTISSMCTVFAESEVVSLVAENYSTADIVHGLNKSVAVKTKALAGIVKNKKCIVMTGGVANNQGVVTELEKQLGVKILIPQNPEFCGALGAALFAYEKSGTSI